MSDEFDPRLRDELHAMSDEATSELRPPSAARARAHGNRIRTRRQLTAVGVAAVLVVAGVGTAAAVLPTTVAPPPVVATPSTVASTPSSPSPSVRLGEEYLPAPDQLGRYAASDWELDPDPRPADADCLEQIIAPTDPQATVERSYRLATSVSPGETRARAVTVQYADEAAAEAAWARMESFTDVCRDAHAAVTDREVVNVSGPFPVTTAEQARYSYIPYATAGDPSTGAFHLVGMVRSGSRIGLIEMSIDTTELTVSDTPEDVDTTGVPLNPMWPTLEAYEQRLD